MQEGKRSKTTGQRCQPETAAIAPALAADQVVFNSNRTGTFEIFTMSSDGSEVRQLTDDDAFDSWWARISPDRDRILFYRTPAGVHDKDYGQTSLWMMHADGSNQVEIRPQGSDGWALQGHAEWSPDGDQLVMFGGKQHNPQVFITDIDGRNARQVTNRGGVNLDPSWSPDGSTIAFVGCPRSFCTGPAYEIYTIPASGGEAVRITEDSRRDHDPYFSPDGESIAWLAQSSTEGPAGTWGIRIADADADADAGDQRWIIDDGHINSYPAWSQDGTSIYFHRIEYGRHPRFSIFQIRPDGSGLQELTKDQPGTNEYPDN